MLLDFARAESVTAIFVVVTCVALSASPRILPPWAVSILLWTLAPLLMWRFGPEYAPWNVLRGSLHPVLIVFLAGFAFAVAAQRHPMDGMLTRTALRLSRGNHLRLIVLLAIATMWLSAWISNVAAAALMFGAVRPLLRRHLINHGQQRTVVLAIAIAANLGGLSTPIGTGANAVAVAAVRATNHVTFLEWMLFAVPLCVLLVGALLAIMLTTVRPPALHPIIPREFHAVRAVDKRTAIIFTATICMWLSEPLHHIETQVVAAAATLLLVVTRAIKWRDIRRIDWGSLVLIAGGIGIGTIMEQSGAAATLVEMLPIHAAQPRLALFVLCLLSATLAAVMSNTGTAALLIPIATAIMPTPSTAILVALATGLGFPFAISTPANAMAVRYGAQQSDLVRLSIPTIVIGSALLAFSGPAVLRLLGVT